MFNHYEITFMKKGGGGGGEKCMKSEQFITKDIEYPTQVKYQKNFFDILKCFDS